VPSPHGRGNPSCYRRLKAFSAEAAEIIGERFVSIDLDASSPATWPRSGTGRRTSSSGAIPQPPHALQRLDVPDDRRRAAQVWDRLRPGRSPLLARRKGYFGSDQAWIGAALGPTSRSGATPTGSIPSATTCRTRTARPGRCPDGAAVVFFHGKHDPWDPDVQAKYGWVVEHYR
jgi:hypothetical protein